MAKKLVYDRVLFTTVMLLVGLGLVIPVVLAMLFIH